MLAAEEVVRNQRPLEILLDREEQEVVAQVLYLGLALLEPPIQVVEVVEMEKVQIWAATAAPA